MQTQNRRLLVADDDPACREIAVGLVAGLGWAPEPYPDGAAALHAISRTRFDGALLDVQMPGLNGMALLGRMRRDRADFPVVLMSGVATPATLDACRDMNVQFLEKPFSAEELSCALESAQAARDVAATRVLVVDDNDLLRGVIQRYLEGNGFTVESFAEASPALAAASSAARPYDLALIDLRLPGMQGMDLVRALSERSPLTLPLVMTGEASAEEVAEAYRKGAACLLTKPLDLERLPTYLRCLGPAMAQRRTQAARREELVHAPTLVRALHAVRERWLRLPRIRRKNLKLMVVVLVVSATAAVPLLGLLTSLWTKVEETKTRIGDESAFMERMEGYLKRDEQRDLRRENSDRAFR